MEKDWLDLIKPKSIEIDQRVTTATYGRFIAEPFERGYGLTFGNALRRILLSSLPGYAITAVRIKGALHEFSSLPGIKEDVTDIILNLKEVRLRLYNSDQITATLKAQGQAVVSAADISGGPELEILTPNQHIATLDKDAVLDMELVVSKGRGYVPSELGEDNQPIGTIGLDATFSPVRKVNFTVSNARVGQRTDYDRLVLEIWTDGSVTPQEALAHAARVLRDQASIFVSEEEVEAAGAPKGAEEKLGPLDENLLRPVDTLPISVRAFNGLQNADIKYVCELVQKSEQDMLKIKNFGRKSLAEVKEVLAGMGLSLGTQLEHPPTRGELDRMRAELEQRQPA
jgi:DNA-directed RNA polymerase subunit alpha